MLCAGVTTGCGYVFIPEVSAVVTYLDHLDGMLTLTGSTPKDMVIIQMMYKRAEQEALYAIGDYFR